MKTSTLLFIGSATALSIQQRDPEANAFIKFPLTENFPILKALPIIGPLASLPKRESTIYYGQDLRNGAFRGKPFTPSLMNNKEKREAEPFIKFPLTENFPILKALPIIGPLASMPTQKRDAEADADAMISAHVYRPGQALRTWSGLKFGGEVEKRAAEAEAMLSAHVYRPWSDRTWPVQMGLSPVVKRDAEAEAEALVDLESLPLSLDGLKRLPVVGETLDKLPVVGDLLTKRDAEAEAVLGDLPVVGDLLDKLPVEVNGQKVSLDKLPVEINGLDKLPVVGDVLEKVPVVGDLLTKRGLAKSWSA